MAASDLDEAIEVMNASEFSNAASLFTGRGADAKQFRQDAEAGNLAVNAGTAAPMAFFHFGGQKDSFFGMVRQGIAPGVNVIATLLVVAASAIIFVAWYIAGEDIFV